MQPLTPEDQATIEQAIKAGRDGSATLTLLARAHDIATKHNMMGVVQELRRRIYDLIPRPPEPLVTGRGVIGSVFMGIISGTVIAWIYSRTKLHEKLGIAPSI